MKYAPELIAVVAFVSFALGMVTDRYVDPWVKVVSQTHRMFNRMSAVECCLNMDAKEACYGLSSEKIAEVADCRKMLGK